MTHTTETVMRESWLVQRLNKPSGASTIFGKDNPFSFGGGLRNGGLSHDAMDLLREVFSFDYMGAAEFEWGAVPEALQRLAKAGDLTAFTVTLPLVKVPANWRAPKDAPSPEGDACLFVICRESERREVTKRVKAFATGKASTKERVGLDAALRPFNDWDDRTVGWLEISNGYFFFTDEQMFTATAALFGVEVQS